MYSNMSRWLMLMIYFYSDIHIFFITSIVQLWPSLFIECLQILTLKTDYRFLFFWGVFLTQIQISWLPHITANYLHERDFVNITLIVSLLAIGIYFSFKILEVL